MAVGLIMKIVKWNGKIKPRVALAHVEYKDYCNYIDEDREYLYRHNEDDDEFGKLKAVRK